VSGPFSVDVDVQEWKVAFPFHCEITMIPGIKSGYTHVYCNRMKGCTDPIYDFCGSRTSDCGFLGYNTCNVEHETIVSLRNITKQIYNIHIDTSYSYL
jgi:hypothetical protein